MQIVLFQAIQFSMSTQSNCQKHLHFKLFNSFEQSYFSLQKFYIKQFSSLQAQF